MGTSLPSWLPGATRDSILEFLERSDHVPVDERVAYFDNDGTMWCERPTYVQFDFFVDALRQRVADEFGAVVDAFVDGYRHRTLGTSLPGTVYQPMLELLAELRAHEFTIGIVTGGGTEFVRQISRDYYGVEPGMVVGTLIGYRFDRDVDGRPVVRRTASQTGSADEGGAKVEHIQAQIGRPPLLAVGNSGGDREMLEWAQASSHGGLAVLVDHDDDRREFAYESVAASFEEAEPITTVAERLGWVVVSVRDDWRTVFATS